MTQGQVTIADVDPQGDDALALLHEASLDARALYPERFPDAAPPARNGPPVAGAVYVIAYVGGLPLACGALRPLDTTTAEVRRMYVHRDHRRQGLGRAVLAHLLAEAVRLGHEAVVLETGNRQHAAMRLYESFHFRRIEPFGEHADDPTSVCFRRSLR